MNTDPKSLRVVQKACAELAHNDHPITFTAVANLTGLARSTLHRNPTIREFINAEKYQRGQPCEVALSEEIATLRLSIETLAQQVRKHEKQIRQLNQ